MLRSTIDEVDGGLPLGMVNRTLHDRAHCNIRDDCREVSRGVAVIR